MKKLLLLLHLLLLAGFAATAQTKGGSDTKAPKGGKTPKTQLKGTFDSKKGVMHHISCHCYNVGYLTTASSEEVVVCFDKLPNSSDLDVNCKKISVEGYYEMHSVEGSNGPCSAGTLNIFYVKKWKCQ